MKEIIVIKQDWLVKDMKAGVPELDKLFICQKVEQVPETFEELKELCKGMYADITEHSITLFGCLEFWDDGKLSFFHYSDIVNNLTPAQMWQIIKSLIGEE